MKCIVCHCEFAQKESNLRCVKFPDKISQSSVSFIVWCIKSENSEMKSSRFYVCLVWTTLMNLTDQTPKKLKPSTVVRQLYNVLQLHYIRSLRPRLTGFLMLTAKQMAAGREPLSRIKHNWSKHQPSLSSL